MRVSLIWALAGVVCFAFSGQVYGYELKGDPQLLEAVCKAHRANRNAIKTWSGAVEVRDSRSGENGENNAWSSNVSFFHKTQPHMARWNWQVAPPDEQNKPRTILTTSNGLIKDGKLLLLEITNKRKMPFRSVRLSPVEAMSIGPTSSNFVPFYYFGQRGENLADRFEYFRTHSKRLGWDGWEVSQDGDNVILGINSPSLNRYTVNLAKGGNLVLYEGEERKDGKPVQRVTWRFQWKKMDGVWLPQKCSYTNDYFSDANGVSSAAVSSSSRTIKWKSSVVNQAIADEIFTPAAIGVKESDTIAEAGALPANGK